MSPARCAGATSCSRWGRAISHGSDLSCCKSWGTGAGSRERSREVAAAVPARVAVGRRGAAGDGDVDGGAARAAPPGILPRAAGRAHRHPLSGCRSGFGGAEAVAPRQRVRRYERARGALAPVAADGRAMPFDPAGLDLPIVRAADSGVVGLLARVQAFDPALFQSIDAARVNAPRGDVLLELGAHRVLLGRDAGPEVIEAVMLVARDLAAKARPYAELDGRYAGQVVVRRRSARSV